MLSPGSCRNSDFYWVFIAIFTAALIFSTSLTGRSSLLLWRSHLSMLAVPELPFFTNLLLSHGSVWLLNPLQLHGFAVCIPSSFMPFMIFHFSCGLAAGRIHPSLYWQPKAGGKTAWEKRSNEKRHI